MDDFNFFMPISKVETQADGSRLVSGYASTPTRDLDGEIVSLDAIKGALPGYWEWRNIRSMHQPIAVGRAQEANVDSDGLFLTAKIVDPACVKLIDEKVLQGFSIGGKKLAKKGDVITELELIEISVVDRPANPDCSFVAHAVGKSASAGVALVQPVVARETTTGDLVIPASDVGPLRKFFTRLFGKGGDAPGDGDKPYGSVEYADPGHQKDGKKRYPVDTEDHIRSAWNYINKPKNAGKYSSENLASIKAKIVAAWKKKIDPAGPPGAATKKTLLADLKKYDGNEVLDSRTALQAIQILSDLLEWEMDEEEDEPEQVAALRSAIAQLKEFVASEITEEPEDGDEGDAGEKAASASPFDQIKEHLEMADLNSILARFSGGNVDVVKRGASAKAHMAKAAHHLGKAMECAKAAHGHFGKCAGCMMDHMKAQKSGATSDHLTQALTHMAAGNAKMEEMHDHHDLAQHHMGKAAGASGSTGGAADESSAPGQNVGGESGDVSQGHLTEGSVPFYDPTMPYPGKAAGAGYTKEIVDQLIAAERKAAAAEAKVDVYSKLPAGNPRAVRFGEINKAFAPGSGAGDAPDAVGALYKNVNMNPADPAQATDAAAQVIMNMHAHPQLFAKSVTDPSFRGRAGAGAR